MKRSFQKKLIQWKDENKRLPLIIQGARQVGKTYLMQWLGEEHFKTYAYFNLDERPEIAEFFTDNKDLDRILESLGLISNVTINADTLLILDEIQECPEALNTLKYFAEKKPEIPIICAGSLLGVLVHKGYSFPVGKVSFLNMYPMTFREILPHWNPTAHRFIQQMKPVQEVPSYFFSDLTDAFKKYLITGGLPAVINVFNDSKKFEDVDAVLQNLILSYIGDFSKHPETSDIAKITQVFESVPSQLAKENKKFVYKLVRKGARARAYEDAIAWLQKTGLIHRVRRITKPHLPLTAYEDAHAFKVYSFDVGLLRKMAKLAPTAYGEGNRLFTEFKGAMAENFILQSLQTQYDETVHYWTSGNQAEVDFVLQHDNYLIPIEVKSDENVRSRSLTLYYQKYNPPIRIRYSLKNLQYRNGLLNIPLFLADYTKDILNELLCH